MSNVATPWPDASTFTEMIRTERSAGVFGTGAGVGDGVGVGVVGVDAGAGVVISKGAGEILTVALPRACRVACPELVEVALGMKMMERGTSSGSAPERIGVMERIFSSLGTVKAAPQGMVFRIPA